MPLPPNIKAALSRPPVYADHNTNRSPRAGAEPQPYSLPPLASDSGTQKPHPSRSLVRITCYRTRRQDADNGVYKWHVDALRLAGIIADDTEDDIKLEVEQIQVATRSEQRTEIEVTFP